VATANKVTVIPPPGDTDFLPGSGTMVFHQLRVAPEGLVHMSPADVLRPVEAAS
jgi:hypothetical protein